MLAPVPLLAGSAAGLALSLAGDDRVLQLELLLPGVAVAAGGAASAAVAAPLIISTARRRRAHLLAEAARRAYRNAAETERDQHRRFLARLDHELKNPIMAIRAQAAAAERTAAWSTVDAQATKLGRVIQDLRKFAELETTPLELEQVDVEALVTDSIAAVAQQHPEAAGRFVVNVTRVPWPVPLISADLDLLSLAVDNVLGNAVKYSAHGPIEVRVREEDGTAVIEVADSGRGIPPADLPHIFDELARAANARDIAGTGLGLTLVKTVLRRHGGTVQVRSLEGSGTVLTLRLPLRTRI